MDLQADLDVVFYVPGGDFTVQAVLSRPGELDVTFTALLTEAQEGQFGGSISSRTHALRYPAHAVTLKEGDQVAVGADVYLLTGEPGLVADGREAEAPLSLHTA